MAAADGGPRGARIEDVAEGSAAADAGLRKGDVVVAVDEVRVDGVDELVLTLRGHGVGRRVVLTYLRDGSEKLAHVVLADRTT